MTHHMDFRGREPTREEVDALSQPLVLEFGASWCHYCQELQPEVDRLLRAFPTVRYIWVEDGKGKPLGRSFRVKLWPTLVFMQNGKVVQQSVRPEPEEVRRGLEAIAGSS